MEHAAIEIENLSVSYGGFKALDRVSLKVAERDYLAVMGPNGGGKSTLLKSILGLVAVQNGRVRIFGEAPRKNRHLIGYVPQFSGVDKDFPITVLEAVLTGRQKQGLSPFFRYKEKDRQDASEKMARVGLEGFGNRRISELSGGEFQKMLIARALMTSPRILLLDEPTASVDARSSQEIYELLGELNKEMAILLVTHNVMAISTHVKELACLNERLVYHGDPELSEEVVNSLYGCPVELVAHGVPHRVLKEHQEGQDA